MTIIDETLKRITGGIQKVNLPDSSNTETKRNDLPGDPDCPICHGIGFYALNVPPEHPEFGKAQICQCRQKEVTHKVYNKLYKYSNLDSLSNFTFETFRPEGFSGSLTREQALSLQKAHNSAMNYASNLKGWFLLMGDYGCGKTHLAAAIANQSVSLGVPTLFLTVPDLLDWMRFAYADKETTFEERFEEIRRINLLVLDDFGTENATAWAQEKLFQILNFRYQNKLPVVITTNQKLSQIEERIQSRLQDHDLVFHINIDAPDYRNPKSAGDHPNLSSLNLHSKQTFDNFNLRLDEGLSSREISVMEKALKASKRFAENPIGWLVFLGIYGTGKTHLAAAIGNFRAKNGYPPIFVEIPDLLDHLRASFHPDSRVSYDKRFDEIRTAPLLILDDLGAQSSTPWAKEKLFQLFSYRYNAELPTVITSSQRLEDIEPQLRLKLIDERISHIHALEVPPFIGKELNIKEPARIQRGRG
jgi:DNA replication protein DnaC